MTKIRNIYLPGDALTALEELRDLARQNEGRATDNHTRQRWARFAEEVSEAAENIGAAWEVEDYETPEDRETQRKARRERP